MATQILRLSRTDLKNQHLLVHASQEGPKSLDLKLIGTDHQHLYHGNIKESNLKSHQANNYSGNLDEWKSVLEYLFLHERPHDATPVSLQGLETVAAISGKTLTLTFRKNIDGITQRLGSVGLDQDDEREEVSPFDWVDTAVSNSDDLRSHLEASQNSVGKLQTQVAEMTKQLSELVKTKKEHEDKLLTKFSALLNAKKLKIRDQQRLLNSAKIDAATADAVSESRDEGGRKRKAQASRSAKRKAKANVEPDDDDELDDEMEEGPAPEATEDNDEETPPPSGTEDERDLDGNTSTREQSNGAMEVDEPQDLPPAKAAPSPADEGDEDDETDDEL